MKVHIYTVEYEKYSETKTILIAAATINQALAKAQQIVKNNWGDRVSSIKEMFSQTAELVK